MSRTGLMAQDMAEHLRNICGDGSIEWQYELMPTALLMDMADAIDEGADSFNSMGEYVELWEKEKAKSAELITLVHDLFSTLQTLCDANECEYCVLGCEPYDQCPIDGLRRRVKECE